MIVYLSGAVGGLQKSDWNDWREKVFYRFNEFNEEYSAYPNIEPLYIANPTYVESLEMENEDKKDITDFNVKFKSDEIYHRYLTLIKKSDIILANFLISPDSKKWNVGTPIELGIAIGLNKDIVTVCDSNLSKHPFIRETSVNFNNLDDAITYIKGITNSIK